MRCHLSALVDPAVCGWRGAGKVWCISTGPVPQLHLNGPSHWQRVHAITGRTPSTLAWRTRGSSSQVLATTVFEGMTQMCSARPWRWQPVRACGSPNSHESHNAGDFPSVAPRVGAQLPLTQRRPSPQIQPRHLSRLQLPIHRPAIHIGGPCLASLLRGWLRPD